MQQVINYNSIEDFDEDFNLNVKKFIFALWKRKFLLILSFIFICGAIIGYTFVGTKKYTVEADLFINKSNNTNIAEINPFVISDSTDAMAGLIGGKSSELNNEIELMQSPLVIDKVIRENHIVYKKYFGFIPNKKEGEFVTTKGFLRRNISFENKKNSNVITIEYTNKNPELAYNVVNSIITHYVELHKEINGRKSKADKKFIEQEYLAAKKKLNDRINSAGGMPSGALSGSSGLYALSAFSTSAQKAMGNLKGQYTEGERSRIAISEDAARVSGLSSKLEWAKLVEEMSDSSNVIVLKEPQKLRVFEYTSPKLIINIILGIIFGVIGAFLMFLLAEFFGKKVTYIMLGDDIVYNLDKDADDLGVYLLSNETRKVLIVLFEKISPAIAAKLKISDDVKFVMPNISSAFASEVRDADVIITMLSPYNTDADFYKRIKTVIANADKKIGKEVLIKQ